MNKYMMSLLLVLSVISTNIFANDKKPIPNFTEEKPVVMLLSDQPIFTITLVSNPTTGYSWFLREYDANLIQPIHHRFIAPTDTKRIGAPGHEEWTFKVKPAGFVVPQQAYLRFNYSRPWEMNETPRQVIFRVSLNSADK